MGKYIITILILSCLLHVSVQDFTAGFAGGKIPRLFTRSFTTTSMNADVIVPFDRPSIFSSTEDIFVATSLTGFGATASNTVNTYPHIEITANINSGRTSAFVNINTQTDFGLTTNVSTVSFNIIAVGSGFQGQTNDEMSSYLFARNGMMFDTREGQNLRYSFAMGTVKSPFNYPLVNNTRCGAFKVSGDWRIEDAGCTYKGYHIFITGFSRVYATQAAAGSNRIFQFRTALTGPNNVNQEQAISAASAVGFSETVADAGINLLNVDEAPTRTDSFFKKVQFSLLFIGIREYTTAGYAFQSIFEDNFKYAYVNLENFPAPGIPLSGANVPIPTSAVNGFYTSFLVNENNVFSNADFSHIFCGFYDLDIAFTTAGTAYSFDFTDFLIDAGNANPFQGVFTDTSANLITLNRIGVTCETFTSRNGCNAETTELTINGIPTVTPATKTIQYVLFDSASGNSILEAEYSNRLGIKETVTTQTTTMHSINYDSVENKGYEGAFEVQATADCTVDAMVTVFGTVVVDERGITPAKEIQFAFFNFDTTGNSMVMISLTMACTGAGTEIEIGIGIREHTNLLTTNGQCTTTCTQAAGKQVGITLSTSPPQCIECDKDSLNQEFYPSLNNVGGCDCQPNRYSNVGVCTPCTDNLCKTCQALNPNNCDVCTENSQLTVSTDPTSGCKCNSGFFPASSADFNTCQKCPTGCLTCTSATTCQTCVTSTTRESATLQCRCKSGFFESGGAECTKCAVQCAECESLTRCTACDAAKSLSLDGFSCVCPSGFFLVITSTNATCEKCDSSCGTCSGTASNCLTCADDTRALNSNGECPCKTGFTDFNGMCIDTNCQSIDPNCQTCVIVLGTGTPVCRTCQTGRVLNEASNKCDCAVGTFEDANGNCATCPAGCQRCSMTTCMLCAFESTLNADNTCSCPRGTFLSEIDNTLFCRSCDRNCAVCVGSPEVCTQCTNGFVAQNNVCICPTGTFLSSDRTQCIACSLNCESCMSADDCQVCAINTSFDNTTKRCVKQCPVGTFNSENQCKQCSEFCAECTASYNCMKCFNGYFKFAGACRTLCPIATFADLNECKSCVSPCKTCAGNAFNCTSCVDGSIQYQGQCLATCPDQTFFAGNTCLQCDSTCFNCLNMPTNCVSCPAGKFLVNGKCENQCPNVLINGVCTNNCPAGTFLNGTSCAQCTGDCDTCGSSATDCRSCKNGLLTYNGNCLPSCPPNTLKIDMFCIDCDVSCEGCSSNPFSCLACRQGFYQLNGRCVNRCPDGFFIDFSLRTCRQCDANCKVCTGPGQCQVCDDLTVPALGQCNNECGANCLKCQNFECLLCAEGTVWTGINCLAFCPTGAEPVEGRCVCRNGILHNNECVSFCPSGTIPVDGKCVACDQNCVECANSIAFCTACPDGLVLDAVSGRCQSANVCAFGRYKNAFGQCKEICAPGSYFLDSTCYINQCPPGYKIQQINRACIEDTAPPGCTSPKFLQGRVCVDVCSPGFYPNTATGVCEGCSPGCYSCLSAQKCEACSAGFALMNQECVSSDKCPNNMVKYQNVCLAFCPIGTFNREGFCLRECPAGTRKMNFGCYSSCPSLSTPDACVATCPTGFTQNGTVCMINSQMCSAGQYFDASMNRCQMCSTACKECSGNANSCTSCRDGTVLDGSTCKPTNACPSGQFLSNTGCMMCAEKCGTCINANDCTSCANGFINTGSDCVRNVNVLIPVQLQVISVTMRDNTAFVQIRPTIIPNGLSTNMQSKFLAVIPTSETSNPIVHVWIEGPDVFVSLRYSGMIPSGKVFFALNSDALDQIYRSMGYSTNDAFTSANISMNLPATPPEIQIPARAISSLTDKSSRVSLLQSRLLNAINREKRLI